MWDLLAPFAVFSFLQHLPLIGGGAQGLCEGEVECRRKTSVECGRKVSFEGGRKVSQEGGRKVSQEGGRKVSQEGGRKVSQEGGRKSSVQSEMESSPVVLKRNGTRLSREEEGGTAKVGNRFSFLHAFCVCACAHSCVCVYVCVCERERESLVGGTYAHHEFAVFSSFSIYH